MPLKDMATSTGALDFLRYADLVLVASVAEFVIQEHGRHYWDLYWTGDPLERPREEDQ